MERVTFMIEQNGERIGCMLNPESLVIRRSAGVQSKRSVNGLLTGAALKDNPVLFTGGGQTLIEIDLLFDTAIGGSSILTQDVRDLTGPLFRLAENTSGPERHAEPPRVRFVWGKAWNVPGVIVAVAERFDRFSANGVPKRSWVRMRFQRVNEDPPAQASLLPQAGSQGQRAALDVAAVQNMAASSQGSFQVHETRGGGASGGPSERIDQLSARFYGDPTLWRLIAIFNHILDPLHILPGVVLRIPPLLWFKKKSS
jgi:nucleoid-associated protein YgaU